MEELLTEYGLAALTSVAAWSLSNYSGRKRKKAKTEERKELKEMPEEQVTDIFDEYFRELEVRATTETTNHLREVKHLLRPNKAGKKDAYLEAYKEREDL